MATLAASTTSIASSTDIFHIFGVAVPALSDRDEPTWLQVRRTDTVERMVTAFLKTQVATTRRITTSPVVAVFCGSVLDCNLQVEGCGIAPNTIVHFVTMPNNNRRNIMSCSPTPPSSPLSHSQHQQLSPSRISPPPLMQHQQHIHHPYPLTPNANNRCLPVYVTYDGKTSAYNTRASQTLLEVKQMVSLATKVPVDAQILSHAGRDLIEPDDDLRTLEEFRPSSRKNMMPFGMRRRDVLGVIESNQGSIRSSSNVHTAHLSTQTKLPTKPFTIYVKTPVNSSISVVVDPGDTFGRIKSKIYSKDSYLVPSKMELWFCSQHLPSTGLVSAYGIRDTSTLHLTASPNSEGGGSVNSVASSSEPVPLKWQHPHIHRNVHSLSNSSDSGDYIWNSSQLRQLHTSASSASSFGLGAHSPVGNSSSNRSNGLAFIWDDNSQRSSISRDSLASSPQPLPMQGTLLLAMPPPLIGAGRVIPMPMGPATSMGLITIGEVKARIELHHGIPHALQVLYIMKDGSLTPISDDLATLVSVGLGQSGCTVHVQVAPSRVHSPWSQQLYYPPQSQYVSSPTSTWSKNSDVSDHANVTDTSETTSSPMHELLTNLNIYEVPMNKLVHFLLSNEIDHEAIDILSKNGISTLAELLSMDRKAIDNMGMAEDTAALLYAAIVKYIRASSPSPNNTNRTATACNGKVFDRYLNN